MPRAIESISRVLAKLPVVSPEKLFPLQLIGASQLACQRGPARQLDRLMDMNIVIQNRLRAIDRPAWSEILNGQLQSFEQGCSLMIALYDPSPPPIPFYAIIQFE